MPEARVIEQLRRRLVELGCPAAQLQRIVREVADHREDLKQAALEDGLAPAGAEVRADTQLGSADDLAERLIAVLRQSSWWGRHPLVNFCALPVLVNPVLGLLGCVLGFWLEVVIGYGGMERLRAVGGQPDTIHRLSLAIHGVNGLVMALVPMLFCWLARRHALSFKWAMTACVVCFVHALFNYVTVAPHLLRWSYSWSPHWISAAIPPGVAVVAYAVWWRTKDSPDAASLNPAT